MRADVNVSVRRPGAASLDLAYVAAGRLDAFWEVGLSPWDTAAGNLLITEAGGRIHDRGEALGSARVRRPQKGQGKCTVLSKALRGDEAERARH